MQDHRAEVAELQEKLAEVEGLNTEITDKLEEHFATYEAEKTEREAELLANNEEIRAVSTSVYFQPNFIVCANMCACLLMNG